MKMNRLIYMAVGLLAFISANAQVKTDEMIVLDVDSITDEQLDTINVRKKLFINDYSMIGIQYGAGLSQVMWNPSQKQDMLFSPINVGITFTTYQKMFGYMPYFGFQAGIFYGKEGYQFEYNEDKDYIYTIEGAEKAVLDVIEVPLLFQFHIDMWNFKIMAQVGCYGGYRLGIERFPGKTGYVKEELRHSFKDTDRRMDYGIKGGVGFALVFEPVEIHFQAAYKHSLASLYEPDYYSKYYYRYAYPQILRCSEDMHIYNSTCYNRYAYPQNIVVSVGTHFHLTKRSGKTKAAIKKLAKDMVYENNNQQ